MTAGRFTDGKPRIATAEEVKAPWGGGFWCKLCGHHFAVGDQWRWVGAGGRQCVNFMVCANCDGDDVLDRFEAATKLEDHPDGAVVVIAKLLNQVARLKKDSVRLELLWENGWIDISDEDGKLTPREAIDAHFAAQSAPASTDEAPASASTNPFQ